MNYKTSQAGWEVSLKMEQKAFPNCKQLFELPLNCVHNEFTIPEGVENLPEAPVC